jgi:hypothetical protein
MVKNAWQSDVSTSVHRSVCHASCSCIHRTQVWPFICGYWFVSSTRFVQESDDCLLPLACSYLLLPGWGLACRRIPNAARSPLPVLIHIPLHRICGPGNHQGIQNGQFGCSNVTRIICNIENIIGWHLRDIWDVQRRSQLHRLRGVE